MNSLRPLLDSRAFLFCLAVAFAGCTSESTERESIAAGVSTELSSEALLEELNPRGGIALIEAWNGSDAEAVAAMYTVDAVVVMDNGTVYRGRREILSGWLRSMVPEVSNLTPSIEQVVGGPERMTLIGTYTARISSSGEPPYQASGIFGNTWVRQADGSWKIKASIASAPSR